MIFSLCGLCLENLPVGALRRTTIDAARAKALVQEAAAADRLIGVAEFGAAPDPQEEKRFDQILDVLKTVHDIDLDRKVFFSSIDDEEDLASGPVWFANALTLHRASSEQPILVVTYYLTPGQDDFLDMDVSPDSLTFDLVEVVREVSQGVGDPT